jgi:hypothetical protein
MTQHDTIESEVRAALAGQAARIPAGTAARLARRDYHPRTRPAAPIAAVGLATAAAVATGSFYAAGLAQQHHPGPVTRAAAQTIRLDDYTFTLPKGFAKTGTPCWMPPPPGLTGTPDPRSAAYAGGAAAHKGCVALIITSQQVTPPASATPVPIGQHQGFLAGDPATRGLTLYVGIGPSGSAPWLVITATGLSAAQVTSMAGRALQPPAQPSASGSASAPSGPSTDPPSPTGKPAPAR